MKSSTLRDALLICIGALTLLAACGDHCVDVVCGPAPPLLAVIVTDTLTIDTTLHISRSNPTRIDTVDTTVVVMRPTADAEVLLLRVAGSDTAIFETLPGPEPGEVEFIQNDGSSLPDTTFMVLATRDGRSSMQNGLRVQNVDGCCPYRIVGRYTLALPATR